jgi:hypothetical protein
MQCKSQISDYNIASMSFGDIAVFFYRGLPEHIFEKKNVSMKTVSKFGSLTVLTNSYISDLDAKLNVYRTKIHRTKYSSTSSGTTAHLRKDHVCVYGCEPGDTCGCIFVERTYICVVITSICYIQ